MTCKLCGTRLSGLSQRLDYCVACGARYIAFDVNLKTGSLDRDWAKGATEELEAMIGKAMFQPQFEATHQLDGLSCEDLFVLRIRALRRVAQKEST